MTTDWLGDELPRCSEISAGTSNYRKQSKVSTLGKQSYLSYVVLISSACLIFVAHITDSCLTRYWLVTLLYMAEVPARVCIWNSNYT